MITGKCLCEGVQYEIEGELGPVLNCHCAKCRRWHGSAFRTRACVDKQQFRIKSGADLLRSYQSSPEVTKHFCGRCGSALHSTYNNSGPDEVGVPLGALEGVTSAPEANIFVDSKASWYGITDSLPRYSQWQDG